MKLEFQVAEHFLCPLMYGAMSGLDGFEIKQLEDFVEDYGDSILDVGEDTSFEVCEICGLLANTLTIVMEVVE